MQKKIIALAVAGLASTAAFAQSNVTVYGVADAAYAYSFGGGQGGQHTIASGGLSGSRLGFKGVEDLGNGLKALFTLEYGLNIDNNEGVGSVAGARQQFIGLTGGFGTAVAGRLQTAGYDWSCGTSPIAGSTGLDAQNKIGNAGVAGPAPSLLACGGNGRAGNAVAYITPTFSGFTGAYNHARVTEAAAAGPVSDAYANLLSVSYANGPLAASAVYSRIEATDVAGSDSTEWGIRASYDFGMAKVFANYQSRKITNTDADEKYSVAVGVPVSAKGTVVAQYAANSIDSTNVNNADSQAVTLAYTHAFSKRTTAYGGISYVENERAAAVNALAAGTLPGKDPAVVAIGLRHSF